MLEIILENQMLKEYGVAIAIFFAFAILNRFAVKNIFRVILKLTRKSDTQLASTIVEAFENPLRKLFVTAGIFISLRYLTLSQATDEVFLSIFRSSIIFFFAWGFYNFVSTCSTLFNEIEKKYEINIDKILIPFFSKILRFLIVIFAIVLIAGEWDYDVNGFIAGLGLGGLAFALAAKDTASNIFGGIVIIFDKPFSIGDWIATPSVEGTVEDINFRSTKVRTFAHSIVTVPNSTLVNQPVTNWTKMGKRRITFNLGVTYNTPKDNLEKCVAKINHMLSSHPHIHQETIFVRFDGFNESSLDIFLYFFTKTTNWGEFLRIKEDVNFKIMDILEEQEVSVAFPSRSIYFENVG